MIANHDFSESENNQIYGLMLFKNVLFFFVLLLHVSLVAQSERDWGMELKGKYGFLAAHRGVMAHLPVSNAIGGELSIFLKTNSNNKKWHEAYHNPLVGLTFLGSSVGNNKLLGHYVGVYSFADFPMLINSKSVFSVKLGAGLGYGTKVYDPVLNPKNVAISTRLNALICIALNYRYHFQNSFLTASVDMTHFSNAAYKVPNLGINLPYLGLGYGRTIGPSPYSFKPEKKMLPMKRGLIGIAMIGSAKEIYPYGGKRHSILSSSFFIRYFKKQKVGWEASLDFFLKQSTMLEFPEIVKTQFDILQIGGYVGYMMPLNNFHFVLGMGYYIRDKYQPDDFLYHRVGFRYYLNNGIHLNCVLKTHWAKADYAEWGIGYTFNYVKE
jgi:hypothetical protein